MQAQRGGNWQRKSRYRRVEQHSDIGISGRYHARGEKLEYAETFIQTENGRLMQCLQAVAAVMPVVKEIR